MLRGASVVAVTLSIFATSAAQAANADWIDDFKTFCGGNPSDFDVAIGQAADAGYRPDQFGLRNGMVGYIKPGDGEGRRMIVSDAYSTQFTNNPRIVTRTCGFSLKAGEDPRARIAAWLGLEPNPDDGVDSYLFHVVDGRRVSLVDAPDSVTEAAFNSGGYWFVGASRDAEAATVTITHFKPTS
jgi:hypothetical protein